MVVDIRWSEFEFGKRSMEEDKDKNATSDMANLRTSKDIKRWMVVEIGEGRETGE